MRREIVLFYPPLQSAESKLFDHENIISSHFSQLIYYRDLENLSIHNDFDDNIYGRELMSIKKKYKLHILLSSCLEAAQVYKS